MTERTNRGSWRINETGDLEEREKSDYAEQYEQEKEARRLETPSVVKPEDSRVMGVQKVQGFRCRNNHIHPDGRSASQCR